MLRQSVMSSSLRSVGYEPLSKTLEIEFKNGDVYEYHEVPENIYNDLMEAQSHGKYFIQHIRNNYPYKKVGITS